MFRYFSGSKKKKITSLLRKPELSSKHCLRNSRTARIYYRAVNARKYICILINKIRNQQFSRPYIHKFVQNSNNIELVNLRIHTHARVIKIREIRVKTESYDNIRLCCTRYYVIDDFTRLPSVTSANRSK